MMTKEDILKELELLPVWQLRMPQPVPQQSAPDHVEQKVADSQAEPAEAAIEKVSEPQFRMIASEDAAWVFVLEQAHDAEAETLLQNMLKAVSVKSKQDSQAALSTLPTLQPKVIVAMGESVAQALLGVKGELEALRSKSHDNEGVAVVVTYSPQYLLKNLSDKAKAWEDLCLAKFTVTSLAKT